MKSFYWFVLPASLFFLLKITDLGVRFSDTNIYFYTAYEVLQGKLLYKDIFFTNLPLFMYISALYHIISGGSIHFYYFTAVLESIITGFLIFLIVSRQTKDWLIATFSSAVYLFSYIVLATSDHQSGVFLASLFAVLSYFFFAKKQYFITGIFVSCMLLTKAYFLPVLLSYFFVLPLHITSLKTPVLKFMLGLAAASIVILLPTILFSFQDFFKDIILYSLIRPQGVSKALIFNALLTREFLLFALGITSIFFFKKYRFFAVLHLLVTLLFLFYKDFYFYYLNIAAPFTCIFIGLLYYDLQKAWNIQKMVIPSLLVIIMLINFVQYLNTTRNQRIEQYTQIVNAVTQLHPPVLYGTNDITPLLSYETGIPLLDGIVDTNPTIYKKGLLNSTALTKKAVAQHALIIGHGVYYPQFGINQTMIDDIFDMNILAKNCKIIANIPVRTEGYDNRLQFVTCN